MTPADEERIREIVREELRANARCTCQYGNDPPHMTPYWYASVKTCARHHHLYDPTQTPGWA